MPEYIERKAAIERLEKLMQLQAPTARAIIEAIPAADVRPVVRGKWTRINYKPLGHDYKCSACGWKNDMQTHFCPNCGAKMEWRKAYNHFREATKMVEEET